MKKIAYLTLFLLVISACKTSKLPKQKPIEETKIEDFNYFIGLSKGDNVAVALKKFGTPTASTKDKKDRYSFFTNYYDFEYNKMVSYTYDKKTNVLNHIRVRGSKKFDYTKTKEFISKKGINDKKVNFLGMHKDEIIRIFGTPDRVSSGNYEYKSDALNITFICYSFNADKCSEMYLFWNHNYKAPK